MKKNIYIILISLKIISQVLNIFKYSIHCQGYHSLLYVICRVGANSNFEMNKNRISIRSLKQIQILFRIQNTIQMYSNSSNYSYTNIRIVHIHKVI